MEKQLTATRRKLLKRLARSGEKLVSDFTLDSFSAMSVKDCRSYVASVEKFMELASNPANIGRFWEE
jgi:hypothetical protein